MPPFDIAINELKKAGAASARQAKSRPPNTMPKMPQTFPAAISGRKMLAPSERFITLNRFIKLARVI